METKLQEFLFIMVFLLACNAFSKGFLYDFGFRFESSVDMLSTKENKGNCCMSLSMLNMVSSHILKQYFVAIP